MAEGEVKHRSSLDVVCAAVINLRDAASSVVAGLPLHGRLWIPIHISAEEVGGEDTRDAPAPSPGRSSLARGDLPDKPGQVHGPPGTCPADAGGADRCRGVSRCGLVRTVIPALAPLPRRQTRAGSGHGGDPGTPPPVAIQSREDLDPNLR